MLEACLQQFLLLRASCPATKKKLQGIIKGGRCTASVRHGRMLGLSDQEFKTTMINMLRALKEKAESMEEQVGNVSREMDVLRKNEKKR